MLIWHNSNGVRTKVLNQAVKRNRNRFPGDFILQLTPQELVEVQLQHLEIQYDNLNRSQIVTGSSKHRDPRFTPYAFTEHGAIMAATILSSSRAVQMSVFIVRAFIRMRQVLMSRNETEKRLDQIEKILLVHDSSLRDLYEKIRPLLLPPPEPPPTRPIGFQACHAKPDERSMVRERRTRYIVGRKSNKGKSI